MLRLIKAVYALSGPDITRFRLAVTMEEFNEMRVYLLATEGKWWSRIRDIPLVIENHPDHPIYAFEQAPDAPIGDSNG